MCILLAFRSSTNINRTSESDLKAFFRSFGTVQSCIVNHDKRHAFLKMLTHSDAMNTKQGVMAMSESEYRHMFERVSFPQTYLENHLIT